MCVDVVYFGNSQQKYSVKIGLQYRIVCDVLQVRLEETGQSQEAHPGEIRIVTGIVMFRVIGRILMLLESTGHLWHGEGRFINRFKHVSQHRRVDVHFKFSVCAQVLGVQDKWKQLPHCLLEVLIAMRQWTEELSYDK